MLAALEWLKPQSEPSDDRLPSEQAIDHYALRGYRGPEVLVAARPFKGAIKLDGFVADHVKRIHDAGYRTVAKEYAERDVLALLELCERSDAVRVVPAF